MQKAPISPTIPDEKDALLRAASLCSQREFCVSQIEEKLRQWGLGTEARERILARLIEERYIDESRFARAYALDKLRYNHWGRVKIGQMLRIMGLSESDRNQALSQLPDEEYHDILRHLVRQKLPGIKARSDYERNGKLMRFLLGRGFEADLIREFIDLP